jgi:SAM-dependent methyltransferase
MSAIPPSVRISDRECHEARAVAESFGSHPERYDRTRPRYPEAMVERIVAASPGRELLDVGCGTGIAARQFKAAGCRVLGVEVDGRMAEFAQRTRLDVEVSKFEDWDAAGRTFDAVIAAQAWHWVDQVAGAAKAASVLRPRGRLAVFWNAQQPPAEVAEAFAEVYRRVLPDTPFSKGAAGGLEAYSAFLTKAADGMHRVGAFSDAEKWNLDWERSYSREEWLDQLPTFGGHSLFPPATLEEVLAGIGAAIDAVGGGFTMRYATVVMTAVRAEPA